MFLVEHHIKYKEIHGIDETVWMDKSAHSKLHLRLRKEGKCNIPPQNLNKISTLAAGRTDKHKEQMKQYKHDKKKQIFEYRKNYLKYLQHINFCESPEPNTLFHERITYNHNNGHVSYFAYYCGNSGYVIPTVTI